jgi:hypothetical protein
MRPSMKFCFPQGITNWLLLRDFNGDGRKDIFTGDAVGVKVYINKTQAGQSLAWQPFLFFNVELKRAFVAHQENVKSSVANEL